MSKKKNKTTKKKKPKKKTTKKKKKTTKKKKKTKTLFTVSNRPKIKKEVVSVDDVDIPAGEGFKKVQLANGTTYTLTKEQLESRTEKK